MMAVSRFRELQQYRQPWVWVLILVSSLFALGIVGYGLVQQLVLKRPWGNQPMSDIGLAITFVVVLVVTVGVLLLFWSMQLLVDVRQDGLFIHYRPVKRRTIAYASIRRVEACRYRPIVEYGGWGIKKGRKGWAYNVSGNQGVRLELDDGTLLLIGSQRPTELAAAIETERSR